MARGRCSVLVLVAAFAACSTRAPTPTPPGATIACDPGRGEPALRAPFVRHAVDRAAEGPGFVDVADMNGDGRKDLVVTMLGPVGVDGGTVSLTPARIRIYEQGASLSCWHAVDVAVAGAPLYFANRPTAADIDGDGDLDLVVPAGFFVCAFDPHVGPCGAVVWLENDGGAWKRHDIVPFGDTRFYHHVVLADLDGDGVKDLVTVAESGQAPPRAVWFKGDATADRFGKTPNVLGEGLGSFPVVADVDGDGDLDVASGEYFVAGESFAWLEHASSGWVKHVADATSGRGFMLDRVPNLYGDGVARWVGANHTNTSDDARAAESGVFVFDPSPDATSAWKKTRISTGIASRPSQGAGVQGAPGVFGFGDVDGDGDIDLAVAGDGDARTFWLEQTSPGAFTTHVIEEHLGQASGARIVDVDGDGKNELVFTGYEDGAVYVYARE